MFCATAQRRERLENFDLYSFRPANSHGFAVSLTIFLSFLTVSRQGSQSHGFWGNIFLT